MKSTRYDYTSKDPMAMPVDPVAPADFDYDHYEDFAAAADARYAAFLNREEGVAVWQRVRPGEVFRDACRDMRESYRLQLGALRKSLNYLTDAVTYLEPWYGIGTIAAAFGAGYVWHPDQAPAVLPVYKSLEEVDQLVPMAFEQSPILQYTRETIDYFLEESQGRLPMSWCDIQAPVNVAGGLINIGGFFMGFYQDPEKVKAILGAITDVLIDYYERQSEHIGRALARPGHGFASSQLGSGMGLSTDNLVMLSPKMYQSFCIEHDARIGEAFGGAAMHSCGDWFKWLEAVKTNPNLTMVDGAFSPQTDPAYNNCEQFRDALAGTDVILHARMVGDPDDVMARVKRLWKPGLKLIVGISVQDPKAQQQLYRDIHAYCA